MILDIQCLTMADMFTGVPDAAIAAIRWGIFVSSEHPALRLGIKPCGASAQVLCKHLCVAASWVCVYAQLILPTYMMIAYVCMYTYTYMYVYIYMYTFMQISTSRNTCECFQVEWRQSTKVWKLVRVEEMLKMTGNRQLLIYLSLNSVPTLVCGRRHIIIW